MIELFKPDGPRVYSIPAGANFLAELTQTLARETGLRDNPEALADALIYVPNRRSERALGFALHQAAGGQACLLPTIRALGDLETDEPPPSAEAALADLPPALSPAQRIGGLTQLVMRYFEATERPLPAVSCLSAARELARLLDQAALSGEVDWQALDQLVPDAQLAEHWRQSLEFLKIITADWPAFLEDQNKMDPYARRYAAAQAVAEHWQHTPPRGPVIIAGSTGATPASRLLMHAVKALPNGCIVLPGLDREMDRNTLEHVSQAPSHPQFALARTLRDLGLAPDQVEPWPGLSDAITGRARRRLIHQALAPAQSTADWTRKLAQLAATDAPADFVQEALSGLTLIEAADDNQEALIAALLMRETLETDGLTAALVTPDAGLARHVSAMLTRWQIDVPPSSGLPLSQTDTGSLALLVAAWMLDPSHPVVLMSVLNHPNSKFQKETVQALDKHFLRGPRTWNNWTGLIERVQTNPDARRPLDDTAHEAVIALIHTVSNILELTIIEPTPTCSGETWYRSVATLAEAIAEPPHPWTGEPGTALSNLFRDLTDLTAPMGPQSPEIWNELLQSEMRSVSTPTGAAHPRLAIWGPLEARLQTADRLILAGLNEDIWPAQPAADAFLPRVFRTKIGLSDPEERVGLSAHDFAQFAAAPDVTLLSSQRRDDKPAIASRWLWRLKTLARGALGEEAASALAPAADRDPCLWLEQLENAPPLADGFSAEPRPKPPIEARPDRLSVTRIEQLVRDPYAIYCESVLGLRPLDRLDLPADVRVRGTAIHKALERFEEESPYGDAEALLALLEEELRRGGEVEIDLIALRDRRRDVCRTYLDWRQETAHALSAPPLTEQRGTLELNIQDRTFTLSGTADRIERRQDGAIAVLDFKTGKPPTEKQVRAGLSPQMPLQGLIAREGGYGEIGETEVAALTYLRFGTQFQVQELGAAAPRSKLAEKPIAELISDAEAGLISVLTAFANPEQPYLSAPRPERVQYESDYTRLARRDEWTGSDTFD